MNYGVAEGTERVTRKWKILSVKEGQAQIRETEKAVRCMCNEGGGRYR